MKMRILLLALAAVAALPTLAQAPWPAKPIHLVVPFTPGAGSDTIARFVAQRLGDALDATIVVDNRTGAGGAIGAAEVARSDPDGYTLLFVASPFTTVAASSKKAAPRRTGDKAKQRSTCSR
jgi:tripartite-type tricarboxylate transporter receptor subunit TctC